MVKILFAGCQVVALRQETSVVIVQESIEVSSRLILLKSLAIGLIGGLDFSVLGESKSLEKRRKK